MREAQRTWDFATAADMLGDGDPVKIIARILMARDKRAAEKAKAAMHKYGFSISANIPAEAILTYGEPND
jgi:hypothetical protein